MKRFFNRSAPLSFVVPGAVTHSHITKNPPNKNPHQDAENEDESECLLNFNTLFQNQPNADFYPNPRTHDEWTKANAPRQSSPLKGTVKGLDSAELLGEDQTVLCFDFDYISCSLFHFLLFSLSCTSFSVFFF
jgi:hypothetical protein